MTRTRVLPWPWGPFLRRAHHGLARRKRARRRGCSAPAAPLSASSLPAAVLADVRERLESARTFRPLGRIGQSKKAMVRASMLMRFGAPGRQLGSSKAQWGANRARPSSSESNTLSSNASSVRIRER